MKTDSKTLFGKTPPVKLFFIAAIPGMISMLAASVYSIMEGMFIGQYLGESAFAAVNLAFPIVLINFSLADLIGVGSSVPISVALGRKDDDEANRIFSCAVLLILGAAILMGSAMYLLAPSLVSLMGADGELAVLAAQYIRAYALCSPLTTVVFAMDNYLRICGFIRGSMLLNIFMTLVTVTCLYLFIGVLGMNVVGAALASCISLSLCAIIAFLPFLFKRTLLKFEKPRFSFPLVREIVACGSPVFLNNISGRLTSILMNIMLLRMGGQTAVAAYAVLMYATEILQPLLYGLCDSLQPAIGFNWGARSFGRVKSIARCTFTASAVVSILGATLMCVFPNALVSVFVDRGDTELFALAAHALRIGCLAYTVRWFGFAAQSFYSAIEMPIPASVLSVSSAMVFPVILVFVLMPLGTNGLWVNMTATALLVSLLAFFMLWRTGKKIRKLQS
jgi:putative MATE family efflux protein